MPRYRNKRVRIRMDGRELPREEYLIGAIANGRVFGKGMKVAPLARLDDGLFDAVFVKGMRFFEFCSKGWSLMNGSHLKHPEGRHCPRPGGSKPNRTRPIPSSSSSTENSSGRFRPCSRSSRKPSRQRLSVGQPRDRSSRSGGRSSSIGLRRSASVLVADISLEISLDPGDVRLRFRDTGERLRIFATAFGPALYAARTRSVRPG